MKIPAVVVAGLVMAVFSPGLVPAAVPPVMNYQGKLTDASGKLVPNGSCEIRFSLYDADSGGTALWTESWESPSAVSVTNGMFTALLGSHTPLALSFEEWYWLGVEVKSGGSWETLSPRQRIASAAYAFRAEKSNEADRATEAETVMDGAITLEKLDSATIPGLDSAGYPLFRVPAVSGITPDSMTEGYAPFTATIRGTAFQSLSQARIGNAELTGENVTCSTAMSATVPSGIPGGVYDIAVSNLALDWGSGSGLFRVNTCTPTSTPTYTPTVTPTVTPTATPTITPTPWQPIGLVAYYKMNDTSGSVTDSSGSGRHGTNNGATRGVVGKIGNAFDFNGTGAYVNTNFGNGMTFPALTISAWLYVEDADDSSGVVCSRSGGNYGALDLGHGDQTPDITIAGKGWAQSSDGTIAKNQWVMVTATYDGSAFTIYVNGESKGTGSGTGSWTPAANFYLGWDSYNSAAIRLYDGRMDEVAVWSRALSPSEVSELWNGGSGRELF